MRPVSTPKDSDSLSRQGDKILAGPGHQPSQTASLSVQTEKTEKTESTEKTGSSFSVEKEPKKRESVDSQDFLASRIKAATTYEDLLEIGHIKNCPETQAPEFFFARVLRTVEKRLTEKFTVGQLNSLFDQWHSQCGLDLVRAGSRDDLRDKFHYAFQHCRAPIGVDMAAVTFEQMKRKILNGDRDAYPACAQMFECAYRKTLAAWCREFQRARGDAWFSLSVRQVEKYMNVQKDKAAQLLNSLVYAGILKIEVESTEYRARRYRYIPPVGK